MTSRRLLPALLACAFAALVPAAPAAEPSAEGTVTGQGTADVKKPPEFLRVQVEVLARGKDLREALARLKERQGAARKQLATLGAAQGTVAFGDPVANPEKNDQQRMMERMVMARMRARQGKPGAKPKVAPPVAVSATLKADLPLKASGADELLLAAESLQEKIKAADLGGLKEFEKASPQEEELAEENQESGMQGQQGEVKRGEPVFVFVAKVSEEERAKALAEAFRKAKRQAGQLARAAGAELGALHHLDGQYPGVPGEDSPYAYNSYAMRALQQLRMAQAAADPDEQAGEALSPQPGPVTYRVAVAAAFTLKPARDK
jgi:uncharacterized protein YggE